MYKNDIANLALGRLGVSLTVIDVETDNTLQAKVIRRHFRMALDTLLEMHDWSFATQKGALALHSQSNTYQGYTYAYSMPGDALVIRELSESGNFTELNLYEDQKSKWEEIFSPTAGQLIHTNVPYAHARYTTRLPENMAFPTFFGRGLAAQLSMDIAPQLITNNYGKVSATLNANARNDISVAIAADLGRQPLKEDAPSPFIRARG